MGLSVALRVEAGSQEAAVKDVLAACQLDMDLGRPSSASGRGVMDRPTASLII